jgi:hypothetical protein
MASATQSAKTPAESTTTVQAETEQVVASVKVRLLKPLSADWEEVGPRLRELAWLGHRVLNGAITRLAMSAELPDHVPEAWCSRRNETSTKRPGGKPSAYQMVKVAIDVANNERVQVRVCAWCGGTGTEPSGVPTNKRGRAIKRTKAQDKHERAPGEVCSRCDGVREYQIGEAVLVPSAIQAGWQRMADRRFATDMVDIRRGTKSLSSYRAPAPIAVTSSGEAFTVRKDERGYVLEIPLYPGGESGRVPFALALDGPGPHAHLQRILGPSGKLGDLKILPPKEGKPKWLAVISYSWERAKPVARSGSDATIRSAADGSPELCLPGRPPKRLYEGPNLAHKRHVFSLRRASRSKHQRDTSAGARGHGRARALEHYHAVDDAERRWIRSVCQEIASKAVREASRRGARWVLIDDTVTILPPATLREALAWVLKKAGFVEPVATGSTDAQLPEASPATEIQG